MPREDRSRATRDSRDRSRQRAKAATADSAINGEDAQLAEAVAERP
jgi:hypothetical protein